MDNFKITIEYDGTAYHGWQRQKGQSSIQGAIEKALQTITRQAVAVTGSGRTDAGVHALGQVANFHCETGIPAEKLQSALNSLLPGDIVIHDCIRVEPAFHARYNAAGKHYRYRILNRKTACAVCRHYVWHVRDPLDIASMQAAAEQLVGVHDFKAFEGAGSPRSHTIRQVNHAEFTKENPDLLIFSIQGNGFLRFMVRNIVGTLVDVGRGNLSTDDFKRILMSRDRGQASPTAPPGGLFLISVQY